MVRPLHVFLGFFLAASVAPAARGQATVQDFDTPGTPYALGCLAGDPAYVAPASPPETAFLRLTDSPWSVNSIAFDRTAEGPYSRIVVEFDFRITSQLGTPAEYAGIGFGLLDTGIFGFSGPSYADPSSPLYLEFQGGEEGSNVNVMYGYSQVVRFPIQRETLDLANGAWHHAEVVVAFYSDGAAVTVTFNDTVRPVFEYLLFGARPYECRMGFVAGTDAWWVANDLDNVRVEFEEPFDVDGWIGVDRWLLLYPLLQSHGCTAGGPATMASNWVAPHVIGAENPKIGEVWSDIDFGGAAASSGWGGAALFPAPTWMSATYLSEVLNSPLSGANRVDFRELALLLPQRRGAYRLQDIEPCTENTTLVPNGGFEGLLPGSCELENWSWFSDMSAMCAGFPLGPVDACNGATVVQVATDPSYASWGSYEQTISLEPDTEYVLSAYLWALGVYVVVDVGDAPGEAELLLANKPWQIDADLGYFMYASFNTGMTGPVVNVRVSMETWLGPPEAKGQCDNIAITRASEFVPPKPIPVSPGLASENALGIAVTYVENRTPGNLDVLLCTSSEDSEQIWVNETMAANECRCGRDVVGCDRTYPATLVPGINKIAVLVWNGEGGWNFALRILRAGDGHVYTDADRSEVALLGTATPVDLRFDEGSGTVANDSSGWSNHSPIEGARWVMTPRKNGLFFDGGDDHVDISGVGEFTEGTIEAWVMPAECGDEKEIVSGLLALDFEVQNCEFMIYVGEWLTSGAVLEANQWYHVAATFDGALWSLYVNGEFRNSLQTKWHVNTPYKFIGQYCYGGPYNWSGAIDEVRIHTRALSPEEIRARYGAGIAYFVRGFANADTELDIGDAIKMCSIMFAGDTTTCRDAIDANDDGELNLADVVTVLGAIFRGWSLPEPDMICGLDETDDALDCESFPVCD